MARFFIESKTKKDNKHTKLIQHERLESVDKSYIIIISCANKHRLEYDIMKGYSISK